MFLSVYSHKNIEELKFGSKERKKNAKKRHSIQKKERHAKNQTKENWNTKHKLFTNTEMRTHEDT